MTEKNDIPRNFPSWVRILTIAFLQIFLFVQTAQVTAAPSYKPATCDQIQADVCVDSAPCKDFNGVTLCLGNAPLPLPAGAKTVPETCWNYQARFSCIDEIRPDSCASLVEKGCTQINSQCVTDSNGQAMTMANGSCTTYDQTYQCQTAPPTTTTVQDCSSASVCSSGNCWSTPSTPDADFAAAVTQMEIARQASVYQGADMRIFTGNPEKCSVGYAGLRKCCDGTGGGQSNASSLQSAAQTVALQGAWYLAKPYAAKGSAYVQDFMFGPNGFEQWATDGARALFGNVSTALGFEGAATAAGTAAAEQTLASAAEGTASAAAGAAEAAGTSGFGAYGITYGASAVQGLEAGSVISGGGTLGGPMVSLGNGFAFDPVSLGIAIAIMIVMKMISCTPDEAALQMHKGSQLCTAVGSYCSQKVLFTCTVTTQSYCCYNSILARIINEQGRPQIGKQYGSPKAPDCSGFTAEELQSLDFGAIDLSEFSKTVTPNLPNMPDAERLKQSVGARQSTVIKNEPAPPKGY